MAADHYTTTPASDRNAGWLGRVVPPRLPFVAITVVLSFFAIAVGFISAVPSRRETIPVFLLMFGSLAAAICSLALWFVGGTGSAQRRMPRTALAMLGLFPTGPTLGSMLALPDYQEQISQNLMESLPALPAVFIALITPAWLFWFFGGWRFARNGDDVAKGRASLRHLMIGTAAVAMALTLARFAIGNQNDLMGFAATCAILAGVNLVATVPAAGLVLGVRSLKRGLIFTSLYYCGLPAVVIGVIRMLWLTQWTWEWEPFFVIGGVFVGYAFTLIAIMLALRYASYRLVRQTAGRSSASEA